MQRLRCAIYTRKSHEEGLEQEFNSLDAQREDCENYIRSQKSLGWELMNDPYDDGGFSGGNTERPALKRLMKDIKNGEIDVVVVYKIDRLSRSLLDCTKLIEEFDRNNVSFVSVTQRFDTSSSMGKLTLNMLMSFAQFEREVISERIRDKIAASKKKGMWMGGQAPLGYDVIEKKLIPNEAEAKIINLMYSKMLEYQSALKVAEELNGKNYHTKSWTTKNGKHMGGKPFDRGTVYKILGNPIYAGYVKHKDKTFEGQHEGIISRELFEKVQVSLKENKKTRRKRAVKVESSFLYGLVKCFHCERSMSPTYTRKKDYIYRYYVCQGALKNGYKSCALGNIPARDIEELITAKLKIFFRDETLISKVIQKVKKLDKNNLEIDDNYIIRNINQFDQLWDKLFPKVQEEIAQMLIKDITISTEQICTRFNVKGFEKIAKELVDASQNRKTLPDQKSNSKLEFLTETATLDMDETTLTIVTPVEVKRKGSKKRIILPTGKNIYKEKQYFDKTIIKAICRAQKWQGMIDRGEIGSATEAAKREGITSSGYVSKVLRLNLLAPDIIDLIMSGMAPRHLELKDLMDQNFPLIWDEQRKAIGL